MAIPWYLMSEPPYYGEEDNSEDYFDEALNSAAASDVIIHNYDMSEHWETRAVVVNRTQETQLNSLARTFLVPRNMACAGMYVEYQDRYWIIVNNTDDNTVYTKCVAKICNVKMMWLNTNNVPFIRYAHATNATQYNNGETNAKYLYFRSDQLLIEAPDDDETLHINNTVRMIFDRRTSLYEKEIRDDENVRTDFEVLTYRVTRNDNTIYNYGNQGVAQFMFTQDEQHDYDGFYRINGIGYWLCKEPHIVNDEPLQCEIICEENIVYIGAGETEFTAQFDDGTVDVSPIWEIDCDFISSLQVETVDNKISISTEDKKIRGKSFDLTLAADGFESYTLKVLIKSFY